MDAWLSWDDPSVAEVEARGMRTNQKLIDYMEDDTGDVECPELGNALRGLIGIKDDLTDIEVYNSRPFWNDKMTRDRISFAEARIRDLEASADIVT